MSNVRIEATGDESLTVEVILGANSRAKHSVEAGQSVDLAVGGGQRLVVRETIAEGDTAENVDLPTGVDIEEPLAQADDPADDSEAENEDDAGSTPDPVDDSVDDSNGEATAAPADWLSEGLAAAGAKEPELETITSEDIGVLKMSDLEADSPLELGEKTPNPFEDEEAAQA